MNEATDAAPGLPPTEAGAGRRAHAGALDVSWLRTIYDGTYEYIGLLSTDGTLLAANRASPEFAGSTREEVVGRPFWDTVWFASTPGAAEVIRDAVARAAHGEFVRPPERPGHG